jgi:ADP-ribosyl-[dinitrogen reductase] hydrolase
MPLHIDAVPVGANGGMIGMTHCPGRSASELLARAGEAELGEHVRSIAEWGAHALVSLIEREEFGWYGVEALPSLVSSHGIRHLHLPIEDMGVPDEDFERAWRTHGAALRGMLLDGGRVVVHCLAGLGRTGTITARLLVELGARPVEAIEIVRRVRPGTIQTPEQVRHVMDCRPVAAGGD